MIDHVFYSTSNSDYQNWQRDLLEYSFKKVNQPGKLWCYCSSNEHKVIPKTTHISKIETVVECPDYSKSVDPNISYCIANKFCSIKLWLEQNPDLSGTVLLIDPDMIFTKKIDVTVEEGTVVGQLWTDPGIEKHPVFQTYLPEEYKHELLAKNIFMYPFCITIKDLKKIIDDYIHYCTIIYKEEKRWESEMYGLVIAAFLANLTIVGKDLGCCNNWTEFRNKEFPIVHYPSIMYNSLNEKIWFKQDFTVNALNKPWTLASSCNQTTNRIEYQLLSCIHECINLQKISKDCPSMLYWNNLDLDNSMLKHVPQKKYIICDPWNGGFNNVRMSFEIAAALAFRLNRILVVPDQYKISMLENINGFDTFFEWSDLGISVLTKSQFCLEQGLKNDWEEIKKISTVYSFKPDESYINLTAVKPNSLSKNMRREIRLDTNSTFLMFDKNLLGNFYAMIEDDSMHEIKNYICKHIHYKENIFAQAYNIIEYLNAKHQGYYSLHLRRNDFCNQYKDVCINIGELYDNIKHHIPERSCLYISTDILNKNDLGILHSHYNVVVLRDVLNLLDKYINKDLYGMIEQIVCTRSVRFIGTKNSTFSSYIYRLRGYMKDIVDKSYYINTSPNAEQISLMDVCWEGNHNIWSREFTDSFNMRSSNETIFVSIASYRDTELEKTIDDLLKKAQFPERVFIGVCLQDTVENIQSFKYRNHPQIRIENIEYQNAKGVCYARSIIQTKLLGSEKYFLQIDSHSRFAYQWDSLLIQQLTSCPHPKPILSCYPNAYELTDNEEKYLRSNKLSPHKYVQFSGATLRSTASGVYSNEVVLSNWIAAGFVFSYSKWVEEVSCPKRMLFNGEEDYLFLQSFLHDYEIFCPPISSVYHCYANNLSGSSEKYRNLVWEDIQTGSLNCSDKELTDTIESISEFDNERFKEKYFACYKTRTILPKRETKTFKQPVVKHNMPSCKGDLPIFVWGISNNEQYIRNNCAELFKTANKFDLKPQLLGINFDSSFLSHLKWGQVLSRLYLMKEATENDTNNKVMIFMDGFDTLFNGNQNQILDAFHKLNTKIAISAERCFTYQWSEYKDKFDTIGSPYKYVAAGTIIGYSESIHAMACECINYLENAQGEDRGNDQGIIGRYVYQHIDQPEFIKLDTNCSIFWVTTQDNNLLEKGKLYNECTNTSPFIYHIVGGNRENKHLYNTTFRKIMVK